MGKKTAIMKAEDPKAGMTAEEIIEALRPAEPGCHPKVFINLKGAIAAIEFEDQA